MSTSQAEAQDGGHLIMTMHLKPGGLQCSHQLGSLQGMLEVEGTGQSHFYRSSFYNLLIFRVLEPLGPVVCLVFSYSRWRFSQAHRWQSVSTSFCVQRRLRLRQNAGPLPHSSLA